MLTACFAGWLLLAGQSRIAAPIDPPPVDEAVLAARLVAMTQPSRGERAIIVYDPTYYPGITMRVREELHRRGVQTLLLVEDSIPMIESYVDDPRPPLREREVVAMLRPVFERSDIFYWMPARGYVDDLRWEFLVRDSRVRSVHFHWMLPFPGSRSEAQIAADTPALERRALSVDLAAHANLQEALAAALRGRDVRLTTPGGTDLTIRVPAKQWFHQGDGDASRARALRARSTRDREIELPVGLFNFVPPRRGISGIVVPARVERGGADVTGARLRFERGRIVSIEAERGADALRETMKSIGPDGDAFGTFWLNTNPLAPSLDVTIEVGANWENGGTNRAERARRVILRFPDATIRAGDRILVENGRLLIRPSQD